MEKTGSYRSGDEDTACVNAANWPACAHLTVKWRSELMDNGATRGRWECTDCQAKFCPSVLAQIHEKMAQQEREASKDAYKRGFYDGYERRHKEVLGALV